VTPDQLHRLKKLAEHPDFGLLMQFLTSHALTVARQVGSTKSEMEAIRAGGAAAEAAKIVRLVAKQGFNEGEE
jgi:hypothetical protein